MQIQSRASQSRMRQEYTIGKAGRRVLVFDDVIEKAALGMLYEYFRMLPFVLMNSDRADTTHVKNFIHTYEKKVWKSNQIIRRVTSLAFDRMRDFSILPGEMRRAFVNLNLHDDIQFIHDDGEVWTVVLFTNAEWREDWGGELLFYDRHPQGGALAIAPKPGRMVIFDGVIPHRGGVPSKICREPRVTFVTKFAQSSTSERRTSPRTSAY